MKTTLTHIIRIRSRLMGSTGSRNLPIPSPKALLYRDNYFWRRVASRFLLPSGSYSLTENVTEIRSLPHNGCYQGCYQD